MEKITADQHHFNYQVFTTWAPAGGALLAMLLLMLAIFKSNGMFDFLFLVFAGGFSIWATMLFFEKIDLKLNHANDTVVMIHTQLLRTGWNTKTYNYRLSQLTHVWMEGITGGATRGSRINLGFNNEWMPLSATYSQWHVTRKLASTICTWLENHGYTVQTGDGWLPGENWKTFMAEAQQKSTDK